MDLVITHSFPKKVGFAQLEQVCRDVLMSHKFGILTEIDVQATLKKKLNVNTKQYKILGACMPPLAHKALQVNPDIGALLPCNVVIYEQADKLIVSALNPHYIFTPLQNPEMDEIGIEIAQILTAALDEIVANFV